jgi:hypothetical protein
MAPVITTAMNRKGKFINIAVLGFYLFYALLPLLYSTESAYAEEQADYAQSSHSTVQRSILEQKLLLVADEDNAEDASGCAQILLKKKRAIAPSFKELVPKLFPLLTKFCDLHPDDVKPSFAPLQISDQTPSCPKGFQRYHSGIAPPSA